MRISDEQKNIFETAIQNKKAFSLDWKFPVEDIVFNVKSVLPNLDIDDIPEKQVNGDWIQAMNLEGIIYTFKSDSPSLILDVIATINKHLEKSNQYLVFFDTQDDLYNFILINLSELPLYLEKGFKEVSI